MTAIDGEWRQALEGEFKKSYYKDLYERMHVEYQTQVIYPPAEELFTAYHLTPLSEVKVVILGQDPYHEPGQAEGLAFSVKEGVAIPPSLRNIYQELKEELGCSIPSQGSLRKWASQGVLLLNSVLAVRAHQANSLRGIGWEQLTDATIRVLNEQDRAIVFLLWGSAAQSKTRMLDNPKHLILKSAHPSPLSAYRGFFGCGHFARCNTFLQEAGLKPIDWQID